MNRADFQKLSDVRLHESRALLASGFPEGAYYLAGYAVECALKACIAKKTKEFDFPPDRRMVEKVYSHDLNALLLASELASELDAEIDSHSAMGLDWETVRDWSERSRYEGKTANEANALLEAIENGKGGFLPWVRLHW